MSLSASWLKKPVVIALIALICGAPVFAMGITNIAQVSATITLSPDSGYGHTIVNISGSGFTGSEEVRIRFASIPVLSTITDKGGSFVGQFVVPTDQVGEYEVSAVDKKGKSAAASFTVTVNPMLTDIENKLDQLLKPPLPPLTFEVKIGALLDFTGDLADYGDASEAAINLAVGEVNELLGEAGAPWTLKVLFKDTQTMPDIALEKLKELYEKEGIKFIVGPLSSAEVREIKEYADANKILVVSHGSTAPDLAIPDDYIFRFCAQDPAQGRAIARLMYDKGKRYVIPVWRGDPWGDGLVEKVKTRFEELTGTFLEGVRYSPEEKDFSEEAADLASNVASALATYPPEQVAVLHISFEEVNAFMTACLAHPILDDVEWYGSDGTCMNPAMLEDSSVRDFAMAVEYMCTYFSPTKSDKYWEVHEELVARLEGREPDPYAYIAYDIVWALTHSLFTVNKYDSEAVRAVLPEVTESLFGASGLIVLDENGDRTHGDYDLWTIVELEAGVKYDWKLVGTYHHDTDSITWPP